MFAHSVLLSYPAVIFVDVAAAIIIIIANAGVNLGRNERTTLLPVVTATLFMKIVFNFLLPTGPERASERASARSVHKRSPQSWTSLCMPHRRYSLTHCGTLYDMGEAVAAARARHKCDCTASFGNCIAVTISQTSVSGQEARDGSRKSSVIRGQTTSEHGRSL